MKYCTPKTFNSVEIMFDKREYSWNCFSATKLEILPDFKVNRKITMPVARRRFFRVFAKEVPYENPPDERSSGAWADPNETKPC
jgi:hypothetical protein